MQATTRKPWDRQLIHGVLSNADLLRGAMPSHIEQLANHCWAIEAKRMQKIIVRGERLPGVFALAHGTVKLSLRSGSADERVVRLAHAGQCFGEASALLGRAARFDATALTACKLVVVPTAALFAMIERDPRSARQLVLKIAERGLAILAELESSSRRGASQRLAAYLERLAEEDREAAAVRLPATKTVIASRLDMKKETLSRLLRTFSERRLIEVAGSEIRILDRPHLTLLAAADERGS
ncbi:MAG: Crp/Fnr family transcriptional regulator [Betaproteobacteria bacterium]|nr:Crp/Fnr family transcriptional regulator [Betaproteobacteria bacterium]